ncbi:hypothetical protein [Draconibacterium orientale]|uniref:hypothetical protein n=1 Tax=Draconibacterium orientale TaxID=1168034 RepID=UPI0029BFC105|nr:hypothetical protein [Draconibacterium orientale]
MLLLLNNSSILEAKTLQLHYWFKDESHTMDAYVHNKCDTEFLAVIKEIATIIGGEISIETQPLENGGLIRWFKFELNEKSKKDAIILAIVIALITGVITTPVTTAISEVTQELIEKIFEDPEIKELEKEKLKLEIDNLKQDLVLKNYEISNNNKIKKRRSNFYEKADSYKKIEKISFVIADEKKQIIAEERTIERFQFQNFVILSDDLDPVVNENAIIEIISPVLKKGPFKWTGIYNGESIDFRMKSNEFKTLVQTGKVEFKNGSSIDCYLETRRKVDTEGNEKIVGYDVHRVNNYFENDKPIETPEGRFYRKKKEADENQLSLYDEYDDK